MVSSNPPGEVSGQAAWKRTLAAFALAFAALALAACGGPARGTTLATPTFTPPGIEAQIGGIVYQQAGCAGCHGRDAKGGIGPSLKGMDANRIERAVRSGPRRMPAYSKAELADEQLTQLVLFVEAVTVR